MITSVDEGSPLGDVDRGDPSASLGITKIAHHKWSEGEEPFLSLDYARDDAGGTAVQ